MSTLTILTLAVGLSMDAFAVSMCKGLAMKKMSLKKGLIIGAYFGIFQAGMPLIGYLLGISFAKYITAVDHWIAFALLVFIGGNMIRESFSKDSDKSTDSVAFKDMILLAVATSIDALAVGINFAFLGDVNIFLAVSSIGIITFLLSVIGVKIGNVFGIRYKSKAELAGGFVLVALGIKILIEHLIG